MLLHSEAFSILAKELKKQNTNLFNILFIEQCLFNVLDESEVLLKNKCGHVDFPSTSTQGTTLDWMDKLKSDFFLIPIFVFVTVMFV